MKSNNSGYALLIVLIVVAVTAVLGVSILGLSLNETKITNVEVNRLQAYYVARAGAETVAKAMDMNETITSIPPLTVAKGQLNADSTYQVSISPLGVDNYKLVSVGTKNGVNSTVTLTLNRGNPFGTFAVTVLSNLKVLNTSNCEITGGGILVNLGAIVDPSIANTSSWNTITAGNASGVIQSTEDIRSQFEVVDSDKHLNGTFSDHPNPSIIKYIASNADETNSENITNADEFDGKSFNVLDIPNSKKVVFEISQDVYVRFKSIQILSGGGGGTPGAGFRVIGNGNLYVTTGELIVDGNVLIEDTVNLEFDVYKNTTNTSAVEVQIKTGCSELNAFIYAPDADIDQSSNSAVVGAIISDTFTMASGAEVVFDGNHIPSPSKNFFTGFDKGVWGDE